MATFAAISTRSISTPPPSSLHSHCLYRLIRGLKLIDRRRNGRRFPLLRLRASTSPKPDSDPVEVIGIGSRKDAVIDFCLSNPLFSPSRLRFWTMHSRDSQKVQLLQRCHRTELVLKDVEVPSSLLPCPPAIILVASTGFGVDGNAAMELLNSAKSAGGVAVAILLKPFSFEGQRRMEEIDDLVSKLEDCSNLFIVVEADSLLKEEMETLAEAVDSLSNAVFFALHTISVMVSEMHLKVLNTPDGQMKEVKSFEILQVLDTYGEAKVSFGAGYNLKFAITNAVFNCPFLSGELKDFNGVILFTLTSSCDMDESEYPSVILNFRQITNCVGDIIFSRIHEPNMEPNLVIASLLIVSEGKRSFQKKSFLSGLALHFPFLFSFFGKDFLDTNSNLSTCSPSVDAIYPSNGEIMSLHLVENVRKETQHSARESSNNNNGAGGDSSEVSCQSIEDQTYQTNAISGVSREQDNITSVGPGFHIAQLWAKERAVRSNQIDVLETFALAVGVKSSSEMSSNLIASSESDPPGTSSKMITSSLDSANFPSRDASMDTGLEALTDVYNTALAFLKGRNVEEPRKRGVLSERAASMLESERDLPKSWTRIMELQYRGGTYRGRCQGGLPEGKGCLTFPDGSFYDGMWHYGKRSGIGTFCYSNGDVFQGTWRDDLMHGKGWFYFCTGDRWFVNFWKGKASGEGRFYSNNGSIFFGCFRNGWRHGEGLCIDVDGSRWMEIWEDGMLVSRTLLQNGSVSFP